MTIMICQQARKKRKTYSNKKLFRARGGNGLVVTCPVKNNEDETDKKLNRFNDN